jgi:hypothetical protein
MYTKVGPLLSGGKNAIDASNEESGHPPIMLEEHPEVCRFQQVRGRMSPTF